MHECILLFHFHSYLFTFFYYSSLDVVENCSTIETNMYTCFVLSEYNLQVSLSLLHKNTEKFPKKEEKIELILQWNEYFNKDSVQILDSLCLYMQWFNSTQNIILRSSFCLCIECCYILSQYVNTIWQKAREIFVVDQKLNCLVEFKIK